MIELREDQERLVAELRAKLRQHQSVLVRAPCGWGKTVFAAFMAKGYQDARKRVIFGVHRRELARQTALTFRQFGISYGFIAAGMAPNPLASVQIASADTLKNHPELLDGCNMFVPDEAHLWVAPTRKAIIDQVRAAGSRVVPLTATPARGDGTGLGEIADAMVEGPEVSWLMERGYLARYRAFAPVEPDMKGIRVRKGEYVTADLEERFSNPQVTGDRLAAYKRFASGKRMIAYCYSRKNGEETAAEFRAGGVPAAFLDGETPDEMRKALIADFADGRLDVLVNCQLFREGFDLSAQVGRRVPIQAVGLYAPTESLPLAIQMMMRPMRPQDDAAIILDHVNLLRTHGMPDDEYVWSLDGVPKRKNNGGESSTPNVTCKFCFAMFRPASVCPECGMPVEVHGREVKHVAGEIAEIDPDLTRQARVLERSMREEEKACNTLADWQRLAKKRGYQPGWAKHRHEAKVKLKKKFQRAG